MGQKKISRRVAPRPPRSLSMSAPTWAYRPKPPLHGLNLSKSPIINHEILFRSSQVIEPDQTKLDFTKPNKQCVQNI